MSGYVPSLEAFTFVATEAEEGQAWLKGKRQVPLGFGWLGPGDPPYDELPIQLNRVAYREFSRNPDLEFERSRGILGHEVFGEFATRQAVDDLLELQAVFAAERTWCQPGQNRVTPFGEIVAVPERGTVMGTGADFTTSKVASERIGGECHSKNTKH